MAIFGGGFSGSCDLVVGLRTVRCQINAARKRKYRTWLKMFYVRIHCATIVRNILSNPLFSHESDNYSMSAAYEEI